jgi:hypothetical protein
MTDNDKKLHQLTEGVTRIANYIEEILHLVKADQERSRKYIEESKDPFIKTMEEGESE